MRLYMTLVSEWHCEYTLNEYILCLMILMTICEENCFPYDSLIYKILRRVVGKNCLAVFSHVSLIMQIDRIPSWGDTIMSNLRDGVGEFILYIHF